MVVRVLLNVLVEVLKEIWYPDGLRIDWWGN